MAHMCEGRPRRSQAWQSAYASTLSISDPWAIPVIMGALTLCGTVYQCAFSKP